MKRPWRSGKTTSTVSTSPSRMRSSRASRASEGSAMAGGHGTGRPSYALAMAERAAVTNAVADLLIGGEHRPAAGGERFAVTNPPDGSGIAEGAHAGPAGGGAGPPRA